VCVAHHRISESQRHLDLTDPNTS